MGPVVNGAGFRQSQGILKSNALISTAQNIADQVVGRRNSTPDGWTQFIRHATLGGELHGKATPVQPADFLFLVRAQEGDSLSSYFCCCI